MIDKLMADLEISKHKNRCGESMNYEKLVALHMYYFSLAWTMFSIRLSLEKIVSRNMDISKLKKDQRVNTMYYPSNYR